MRRTGRVVLLLLILLLCMLGLWMFQAWREGKQREKQEVLHNVYITGASGTAVAIAGEENTNLESAASVSGEAVTGVVADLYLQDKKIVRIVRKPEYVTGTIQKISDGSITIDEYGEVEFAKDFALYHISKNGHVTKGKDSDLAVGQPEVRFIAAGSQICAAVVPERKIDKIRVLLQNSDFSSYSHEKVILSTTAGCKVKTGGKEQSYKKGEKITIVPKQVSSDYMVDTGGKGKICFQNLKRQCGTPEYRGLFHITKNGDSLYVVNELPLEEYLYSVVPSEMPTEYSMEALKAQAVCARSYAAKQMKGKRLAEYGAHVDDGVSFQVYNNQKEDSRSIEAVNATAGRVVVYQNKIAVTYFYSASCGSRAGTKDVWFTAKDAGYLPSGPENGKADLSEEGEFTKFIKSRPKSLDSDTVWFRWNAVVGAEQLRASLEKNLPGRCLANPSQIQVKQKDGNYRSETLSGIGQIQNIVVKKRGKGGVVSMVEIEGSEHTIHVYTEYNIRILCGGTDISYVRNDKKSMKGLSLLPSGFFCVEKKDGKFLFSGGGYGHGVGMSQNGANAMAKQGKNYQDILTFYFPGTSVEGREAAG